ncbi:hypothetical protein GCM10010329_15120 [Streptomyces spiroverticillatus]|uniref:Uncharacterized protein n=1 Tax=Streptomyces finlayi TaxID=67296 RepID=A0A919CDI3_9ACTN|nr:hypothetical protein GCM10010329_15120 [Streptomyces spiroverticillatus]GHD07029.1 hypothetical protein GCM10010334_59150 [Streptomyces finlayi]
MVAWWFQPDSWATMLLKHWNCAAGIICRAVSWADDGAAAAPEAEPRTAPAAPSRAVAPTTADFWRAEKRLMKANDT